MKKNRKNFLKSVFHYAARKIEARSRRS